jgi:ADP-L-glycero-D-manno-heptose 6-epimerase
MTLHAAEHPSLRGLVNVGSGHAHTWIDLATAVFDAMGARRNIEFVDMPEQLRGKYQYSTRAMLDRLRESGYDRAPAPLASAVAEYVRDYLIPNRRLGDEASVPAAHVPLKHA